MAMMGRATVEVKIIGTGGKWRLRILAFIAKLFKINLEVKIL